MKRLSHFRLPAFVVLFFFLTGFVSAQSYEAAKTVSRSAVVPGDVTIDL